MQNCKTSRKAEVAVTCTLYSPRALTQNQEIREMGEPSGSATGQISLMDVWSSAVINQDDVNISLKGLGMLKY